MDGPGIGQESGSHVVNGAGRQWDIPDPSRRRSGAGRDGVNNGGDDRHAGARTDEPQTSVSRPPGEIMTDVPLEPGPLGRDHVVPVCLPTGDGTPSAGLKVKRTSAVPPVASDGCPPELEESGEQQTEDGHGPRRFENHLGDCVMDLDVDRRRRPSRMGEDFEANEPRNGKQVEPIDDDGSPQHRPTRLG